MKRRLISMMEASFANMSKSYAAERLMDKKNDLSYDMALPQPWLDAMRERFSWMFRWASDDPKVAAGTVLRFGTVWVYPPQMIMGLPAPIVSDAKEAFRLARITYYDLITRQVVEGADLRAEEEEGNSHE